MQPSKSYFLHWDEINVMTKMSTNELNPCWYTWYFSFANALIVKLYFLKLLFPFFGFIFLFQTFIFEVLYSIR